MNNILFSEKNCDFEGVLISILSILKKNESDDPYTFYICDESNNSLICGQMLEYLNDIVIGFNYKNKVVKVETNNLKDIIKNYKYTIMQGHNCKCDDILKECDILKEIYQGGVYYA